MTADSGHRNRRLARARSVLSGGGWSPGTRSWLDRLMVEGAGRRLPVAFDFDNTLVCGDIGEATLAALVKRRQLKPEAIARLCPPFRTAAGRRIALDELADVTAYYEALLDGSGHGAADPNPLTSGYAWAVEIMAGLTPAAVVRATAASAAGARAGDVVKIEPTPGQTAYAAPWFYPEMVELVAGLIEREFDVWIVSASNAWSVRWMVLHRLNPRLARIGCSCGVAPDHVIGVTPLLTDRRGCVLKDSVLVRTNPGYAQLEPRILAGLCLGGRLDLPVPVYSGKVACLWDRVGGRPYLAVGDSPGDIPMLSFSHKRLWINRIEKAKHLEAFARARQRFARGSWAAQPVRTQTAPGFLGGVESGPGAVPEHPRQWKSEGCKDSKRKELTTGSG